MRTPGPHLKLRVEGRRSFLRAAGAIGAAALLRAQQDATFSTVVKVVNVLATVRDKQGALLSGLNKDDFTLAEDGRSQEIRYFAKQSDLPLTIGLMVDTSMSQVRVLNAERGASFRFIDQVLRETKDQVFLMQFDMSVATPQGLTSSRKALEDALAYVDTPTRQQLEYQGNAAGTLLYDAIVAASKNIMSTRQGRKALMLLTDGVDTGSDATLAQAVEAAQRADTLLYSILFADRHYYGGGEGNGRGALVRMSKETGGGFFEVSKKLGIDKIYALIEEELRSQYSLGYVSDKAVRISEFRKIQLKATRPGLFVQARDRYWAQR